MFNDEEMGLTAEERTALAALPKEHAASDLLEERVVRELRSRGFFVPRRRRDARFARVVLRAAAAVVIFVAGAAAERFLSERSRADEATPARASRLSDKVARPTQMELWI